jgi:hypothetical protein
MRTGTDAPEEFLKTSSEIHQPAVQRRRHRSNSGESDTPAHLIRFCQGSNCRTIHDMPISLKTRAMARAIPGPFDRIPLHDAAEMGAERRPFMKNAGLVAMYGDFGDAAAEDGSLARADL